MTGAVDPPADVGAERQLLGALLLDPEQIDKISELITPEDFYRPAHETIYRAILDQRAANEPVDAKLVSERLRVTGELNRIGSNVYLYDLIIGVLVTSNADYYAAIIARCSAQRALVRAGQRITQMAVAADLDDIAEIQALARLELDAAITERARDSIVWAYESSLQTIETIDSPPNLCGTGWADIDRWIGGTAPGRLYVIGARPSVGKTVMAVQWALFHASRYHRAVVYFTLEMARREIDLRLLSQRAGVNYASLEAHSLTDQEWGRVNEAHGGLKGLPLTVVDRANMRIEDVRRITRRIARDRGLGMVIVDYLQLMTHTDPRMPRHQQVADISRALKLLSREVEAPVVAVSQLNRASEQRRDRTPGLHDLRESGAVEQDSDVVILLHRNTEDSDKGGQIVANVAKNRHGPPGEAKLQFNGPFQRIQAKQWDPSGAVPPDGWTTPLPYKDD